MQLLRTIVATIVVLVASMPSADSIAFDTDMAYILVRARVADETARQPTWIAFITGRKMLHVPAGQIIVELDPGTYEINHVDFSRNKSVGIGTKQLTGDYKLELIAGEIFLVGEFLLTGSNRRRYVLEYGDTVALISAACRKSPEFFKHFPLRSLGEGDPVMVPCDELLSSEENVEENNPVDKEENQELLNSG